MKSYTIFPDIVFSGTLPVDSDIKQQLLSDTETLSNTGACIETTYGWLSNKDVPVKDSLRKLQLLLGRTFVQHSEKAFGPVTKRRASVVQPHIVSIKPMHTYDLHINSAYWYQGCAWLQTTDKGNHLFLESPSAKRYACPPAYQQHQTFEQAESMKYVFWPAHIQAGFTPNQSMINSIIFNFGITSDAVNRRS